MICVLRKSGCVGFEWTASRCEPGIRGDDVVVQHVRVTERGSSDV